MENRINTKEQNREYDRAVHEGPPNLEDEYQAAEVDPAGEDDFSSREDETPGTKEMDEEFNASDIDAEADSTEARTLGDLELDDHTGMSGNA